MTQNHPNFKDAEYIAHENQLTKVNNVYKGTDTSKQYIDKFGKEDEADYIIRQKACTLDNYVFRTVQSIKNIIFRKSLDLSNITNKELLGWLETANFKDDINEFAKDIIVNRVRDGIAYILVDAPTFNENMSKLEQEQNNIRPYFTKILRSQVLNKMYDDNNKLIQISISEQYKSEESRFGAEYKEQIKAYELIDGVVQFSIWRENAEVQNDILTIDTIPIVEMGDDLIPPLYDQALINLNHLNRNSEKSNYVRVGACPFPIVKGTLKGDSAGANTLSINQGLQFADSDGSFEWAEMSGANYTIIQEEIKYRENQMERISVEFTTQVANITATEVEKNSMTNESKLMDYSLELEGAINKSIQMMGEFTSGISENDVVLTNKDFDSSIISEQEFNMLMALRINGDLSYKELRLALEKGEVLRLLDDKEKAKENLLLRDDVGIEE